MVALADGVEALLTREGVPNGWPIFVGRLSGSADRCIGIMERAGSSPEVKIAINYPSFQLLVRGGPTDYALSRTKAFAAFDALHGIEDPAPEFPELTSCIAIADPGFIGYDERERPIWSVNFRCILTHPPTDNRPL